MAVSQLWTIRSNPPASPGRPRKLVVVIKAQPRRLDHAAARGRGRLLVLAGKIPFPDRAAVRPSVSSDSRPGVQRLAGFAAKTGRARKRE